MAVLLYGATGYTGRLIAARAAEHALPVVLAGRDANRTRELAGALGCEFRAFALDRPDEIRSALDGVSVVLNCAGPFVRTWRPLVAACLEARAHYVDITGEVDVFEGIAAIAPLAAAAGVLLLPGAGFDVVPTDCLAAHLAERLPSATRLQLGITSSGRISHGTASTMIENQARGGLVRRGGVLTEVPAAWRTRTIDFGDGRARSTVTIPWGDVSTAWRSTGIGDIEVFAAAPAAAIRVLRMSRHLGWLLRRTPVTAAQRAFLRLRPAGPDDAELARGSSRVWGRVEDDDGRSAEAVLRCPNAYLLTAQTALLITRRILDGGAQAGFLTPSLLFGSDFILEVPGVERRDLPG